MAEEDEGAPAAPPVADTQRAEAPGSHGIVKNTVGQRDTSGRVLEIFAANGATFSDIVHKLWKKFSCHVKGVAVKQDDTWTVESPVESAWSRAMQFKSNGRIVTASSILLPTCEGLALLLHAAENSW
uniref:Uncharacterized protein n=1 Tax=Phytophthora ramorum TaxID=164328 RepID=H3GJJ0_PHYRM